MSLRTEETTDRVLLDALVAFVEAHPDPDVQRFRAAIADWGQDWSGTMPVHLNASDTLEQALGLANAETADLTALFVRHRASLRWEQSYTSADSAVGDDMLSNYAYAEIIGNHGPFVSTRVRAGIAVYGPHLKYPPHRHVAEEIYALLAGCALCSLGDTEPAVRRAGDVLYHAPQVSHGFHTSDEPLVIAYLWQNGDLREKPSFV